jgi:hypothetical protein
MCSKTVIQSWCGIKKTGFLAGRIFLALLAGFYIFFSFLKGENGGFRGSCRIFLGQNPWRSFLTLGFLNTAP